MDYFTNIRNEKILRIPLLLSILTALILFSVGIEAQDSPNVSRWKGWNFDCDSYASPKPTSLTRLPVGSYASDFHTLALGTTTFVRKDVHYLAQLKYGRVLIARIRFPQVALKNITTN